MLAQTSWKEIEMAAEYERILFGIRRRLSELDQALKANQNILIDMPDSFAFRLSLHGLLKMKTNLRADLVAILRHRKREIITISLDGNKFSKHTASLSELGHFLVRLQALYTSIAQAIKTGPTLRGRIAAAIQAPTEMRMASVFPSSFGMNLFVQSEFDLHGNSISSDALDSLFQLLTSCEKEPDLMRLSGELGRRAFNHLRRMATDLRNTSSQIKIEWSDYTGTQHVWDADSVKSSTIVDRIDNITETNSTLKTISGRLVGASLLKNRFEILTGDMKLIEGKVVSGLTESLEQHFGDNCHAEIVETELLDKGNQDRKTYYTLVSLSGATNTP